MSEEPFRYLESRVDRGLLVLTITVPVVHGDELAEAIYRELVAAAAGRDRPRVAVNFENVTYLSAASLRILLDFRRHLRERDGQMLLCGLYSVVADVFATTRLVSTTPSSIIPFGMAADVATAVDHLSKTMPPEQVTP